MHEFCSFVNGRTVYCRGPKDNRIKNASEMLMKLQVISVSEEQVPFIDEYEADTNAYIDFDESPIDFLDDEASMGARTLEEFLEAQKSTESMKNSLEPEKSNIHKINYKAMYSVGSWTLFTCLMALMPYKGKVTSEPIIQFSTKELLHKNSDQPLLYPEETYMLVLETNEIDELQKEKYITLKQGDNIFGRDKQEADFVIEDRYVSKKHFIIKVFGTQLILIDCESMNGTYLNHKRVDVFPESIKRDDEIQVSQTKFIVKV